jgi:hypothetical protein
MKAIEFQTTVRNGMIRIPEAYRKQFDSHVRVVLMRTEEMGEETTLRPQFGGAKGKVRMSKDFDDPLDMFKEYGPNS